MTRQLLSDPEPPTAFIYESDILAVAGLGVAHEMGLDVPGDVSIIACDDSPFCQVVHPPISAITRDIPGLGAEACKRLLELIELGQCGDLELPYGHLTPRGSTGRAFHSASAIVAPTVDRPIGHRLRRLERLGPLLAQAALLSPSRPSRGIPIVDPVVNGPGLAARRPRHHKGGLGVGQ